MSFSYLDCRSSFGKKPVEKAAEGHFVAWPELFLPNAGRVELSQFMQLRWGHRRLHTVHVFLDWTSSSMSLFIVMVDTWTLCSATGQWLCIIQARRFLHGTMVSGKRQSLRLGQKEAFLWSWVVSEGLHTLLWVIACSVRAGGGLPPLGMIL